MSKASRERQEQQEKKAFFEQKWFKLIYILGLFGWLFYQLSSDPFQIDKNDLVPITVTVKGETRNGGRRDPIQLYFNIKEYKNRFGMYIGGPIDRWTEVKEALTDNETVEVKIHEIDTSYFNTSEVIMVYYLKGKNGVVFDEDDFNEGEKRYDRRWLIVLLVIFTWVMYLNFFSDLRRLFGFDFKKRKY